LFQARPLFAQALEVTPSTVTLTMPDAIRMAIQNNLTVKLAHAQTEEARGKALQDASGLLPQITGAVSQARVFKVNLEAQGFPSNLGIFPSLIGPFNTFDARFRLSQRFLDLNAWWKREAGQANRKAAGYQEELAKEQIAAAAGLAYVEVQRATRAVSAAQADVKLAQSLLTLAQDQRRAGISTGVDVARAETSAAQERLRLIRAQVSASQADIILKRVVGVSLETPVQLPIISETASSVLPALREAIDSAQGARPEMLLAKEKLDADQLTLKAAKAENYPTVAGLADYGYSGTTPSNVARTGSIAGAVTVPILNGGSTHGKIVEAKGRYEESESRYSDTKLQIEEDVRLAVQTLQAENDEVTTANQAVQLAQKELTMARDRFSAGVGDNIQLLTAEDALDRALDDQVNALARFDTARINFASALGQAQRFQ
jgi:outer membrane protein